MMMRYEKTAARFALATAIGLGTVACKPDVHKEAPPTSVSATEQSMQAMASRILQLHDSTPDGVHPIDSKDSKDANYNEGFVYHNGPLEYTAIEASAKKQDSNSVNLVEIAVSREDVILKDVTFTQNPTGKWSAVERMQPATGGIVTTRAIKDESSYTSTDLVTNATTTTSDESQVKIAMNVLISSTAAMIAPASGTVV